MRNRKLPTNTRWLMLSLIAWLLATPAHGQQAASTCDFNAANTLVDSWSRGDSKSIDDAQKVCPLPTNLVDAPTWKALDGSAPADFRTLNAALTTLANRVQSESEWGPALAKGIAGSQRTCSSMTGSIEFAKVSPATENDEVDCECFWVTGRLGSSDRTCYRVGRAASCTMERVVSFKSWPDASTALYAQKLAHSGLTKFEKPCVQENRDELHRIQEKWKNLAKYGYLQYPWELIASRALDSYSDYQDCFRQDGKCKPGGGLDPERTRLILGHPALGLAFSGFGKDAKPSANADAMLALEAIGFVRYNQAFERFYGLSAAVGFAGADFGEPRVGLFVHMTRWVHLGYLVCVAGDAKKDASLVVAFDAASWIGRSLNKNFLHEK